MATGLRTGDIDLQVWTRGPVVSTRCDCTAATDGAAARRQDLTPATPMAWLPLPEPHCLQQPRCQHVLGNSTHYTAYPPLSASAVGISTARPMAVASAVGISTAEWAALLTAPAALTCSTEPRTVPANGIHGSRSGHSCTFWTVDLCVQGSRARPPQVPATHLALHCQWLLHRLLIRLSLHVQPTCSCPTSRMSSGTALRLSCCFRLRNLCCNSHSSYCRKHSRSFCMNRHA